MLTNQLFIWGIECMSSIESRLGNLRRSGVFTTSTSGRLGFLDSSAENLVIPSAAVDEVFSFGDGSRTASGGGGGGGGPISLEAVHVAVRAQQQQQDEAAVTVKYRALKRQYAILDAASRSSVTEREKVVSENKDLKFRLAKSQQACKLGQMEVDRLQSQIVAVQATMTEFAAQAKRDRDEAVSETKRLMREERGEKRPKVYEEEEKE